MTPREKVLTEQTRDALRRARKAELQASKLAAMLREKVEPETSYVPIALPAVVVAAGATVCLNTQPNQPCIVCRLAVDVRPDPATVEMVMRRPLEELRDELLVHEARYESSATVWSGASVWARMFRWTTLLEDFAKALLERASKSFRDFVSVKTDRILSKIHYDAPRGDVGEVYLCELRIGRASLLLSPQPISVAPFRGSLNEDAPEGPPLFMQRCELGQLVSASFENRGPVAVTVAATLLAIRDDVEVVLTQDDLAKLEAEVDRELEVSLS